MICIQITYTLCTKQSMRDECAVHSHEGLQVTSCLM